MKLFGRKPLREPAPEPQPEVAENAPMARTILIVDDNPPFRGMLKSMLAMRGYNIVAASGAAEGLRLAAEMPVDGILVDYNMPETNGIDFCRMLREQNESTGRDIPAWIITGTLHTEVGKYAADAGALLVIRKPFSADQLCARLEDEFLRRSDELQAD